MLFVSLASDGLVLFGGGAESDNSVCSNFFVAPISICSCIDRVGDFGMSIKEDCSSGDDGNAVTGRRRLRPGRRNLRQRTRQWCELRGGTTNVAQLAGKTSAVVDDAAKSSILHEAPIISTLPLQPPIAKDDATRAGCAAG